MKQVSINNYPAAPSQLPPHFDAWISKEKTEARLHRQRIFQATLFIVTGCVLFLLKEQLYWVQDALNLVPTIANQ